MTVMVYFYFNKSPFDTIKSLERSVGSFSIKEDKCEPVPYCSCSVKYMPEETSGFELDINLSKAPEYNDEIGGKLNLNEYECLARMGFLEKKKGFIPESDWNLAKSLLTLLESDYVQVDSDDSEVKRIRIMKQDPEESEKELGVLGSGEQKEIAIEEDDFLKGYRLRKEQEKEGKP